MRLLAIAILALGIGGCVDDGWSEVKLGALYYFDGKPKIDTPTSAMSGQSVAITAYTGGGGCVSVERTDVEMTEDGADIFPYDRYMHPGEGAACTQELRAYAHPTTVMFDTASEKTIRLHGIKTQGFEEQPVEFLFTLDVQ